MKRCALRLVLLFLVPMAACWVRMQERRALREGQGLSETELASAKQMGVIHPENIRLLIVNDIQGPRFKPLRMIAHKLGFFGSGLHGITYRYGIFIREDCYPDNHLIAHECVHTGQYERLGGLCRFLYAYFYECLTEGYPNGPLEQEAIQRSAECVDDLM